MSNALQKIVAMHKLPFVRKLATFQVSTISIAAIAFLSSVIQARWLGTELFGYLAVITAFAGLLNFFTSMGQETTLATFFAEAYGKKDRPASVNLTPRPIRSKRDWPTSRSSD